MRSIILVKELFDERAHFLNNEVDLSLVDVVSWCQYDAVTTLATIGTSSGWVDVDVVRIGKTYQC